MLTLVQSRPGSGQGRGLTFGEQENKVLTGSRWQVDGGLWGDMSWKKEPGLDPLTGAQHGDSPAGSIPGLVSKKGVWGDSVECTGEIKNNPQISSSSWVETAENSIQKETDNLVAPREAPGGGSLSVGYTETLVACKSATLSV